MQSHTNLKPGFDEEEFEYLITPIFFPEIYNEEESGIHYFPESETNESHEESQIIPPNNDASLTVRKVDGTIVSYPNVNSHYSMDRGNSHYSPTVLFNSTDPYFVTSIKQIDCSSGYICSNYGYSYLNIPNDDLFFVPVGVIPHGEEPFAPIQVLKREFNSANIYAVKTMTIESQEWAHQVTFELSSESQVVTAHNANIAAHCRQLVSGVPIEAGESPILLSQRAPSYEFLENVHNKFLSYNKKIINEQRNDHTCHLRAHALNLMFELYGITSLKIFKQFNSADWKNTHHQPWGFHCALMFIDDKNQLWIFDPWWGGKSLQSLRDWLIRDDEPRAEKVMVSNRAVISDYCKGREISGVNLWRKQDQDSCFFINEIQKFFSLTVPFYPDSGFPKGLNKYSLFRRETQPSSEKDEFKTRKLLHLLPV